MKVTFEACPECRKLGKDQHGDNLAAYDDGHKYCFACGYYEGGNNDYKLFNRLLKSTDQKEQKPFIGLPSDAVSFLNKVSEEWLKKYWITSDDIYSNRMQWSFKGIEVNGVRCAPLLIFPFYDPYGHLLMWQGRNFGSTGNKYITIGDKEKHLQFYGTPTEEVCLVEDIVSAIRVGKVMQTMPLLGTTMSQEKKLRLATQCKKIVIWLDPGAQKRAFELCDELSPFFDRVRIILSEQDPKWYTGTKIKEYLAEKVL